ncbi:DUF2938 domain-containing protein [Photobacterium sp. CAU 1568]|uniref:DUF2938 domain-containing protein n=1 Tax=Photobacterium arenosum TaxID=2774143 RepID=A0ABR9BRE1_9GAMM|nr:DUF2938 domain-containing protein [Photobacterium arenosum]MBD8515118.1 DUF2938 domain-containing protein [Photobacterium arenosum]
MEPDFILRAIALGIGATLVMDLWALFLKVCFKIPSLNYSMVGRWIGHFPKGQFTHANIGKAEPVAGETLLGWTAHYAIGICFAAVLLWGWGLEWAASPTLLPALIVGVLTVVAPFFLMQPGMGAGVAASKTPQPNTARLRSLLAHTSYGVGLYLTGIILSVY